ncbi:MAG: S8 family serine peptidase [Acidimicrobiales bacterium]
MALIHHNKTFTCVALSLAFLIAGVSYAGASDASRHYMLKSSSGVDVPQSWRGLGGGWFSAEVAPELVAQLRSEGIISQSYEQQTYELQALPNDPCLTTCVLDGVGTTTQWSVVDIGLPAAWDKTLGDDELLVAILDAGIRDTHQELVGRIERRSGCGNPSLGGTLRHGTLSAGLLGATSNDGLGIAGALPKGRMLDVQVLGPSPSDPGTILGSEEDIVAGVRCAADAGAKVISMSFSGVNTPALADAVRYAYSRGIVLVASAGNSAVAEALYPAAYPEVVGVAATERSGALAAFSTFGPSVSIAAPGMGLVTSTADSDTSYELVDGTSFSAPLVAGVAGLLVAAYPDWSPAQVMARLERTADALAGTVDFGRLNAAEALLSEPEGYWVVGQDGSVAAFGDAASFGAASSNSDIVGIAGVGDGSGYWLVAADGGVFAFGSAEFYGSAGALALQAPVTALHVPAQGPGYLLVAADGGIFTYGQVGFLGSAADIPTISPVVGSAGF